MNTYNNNPFQQLNIVKMLAEEISGEDIVLEDKSKKSKEGGPVPPLNMDIINQLQLKVNTNNQEDLHQINNILVAILDYPITEIAETHSEAMKLGNFDLQVPKGQVKARLDTSSDLMDGPNGGKQQFCRCCGFVKQHEHIKMCTPFNGIKNMGLSTYLFFATFKNLSILLMIMTLMYSIFSLATNVLASSNLTGVSLSSLDYIAISLSSKMTNDTTSNRLYYYISCWLGVAMILLWIIALVGIKYKDAKDSQEYDQDTISCSDYSIIIQGMPVDVRQEELQIQLNQYFQTSIKNNNKLPAVWKQPLAIAKVNAGKPFYLSDKALEDEQLDNIKEEIEETKEELINFIKERQGSANFSKTKPQREAIYSKYAKLSNRRIEKVLELSQRLRTMIKNQDTHQLTTVFVTFQINNAKTVIDHIHQTGLLGRIRALCSDQFKRFSFKRGDNELSLDISRAPEPEDIIWQNIGHKDCATYGRKFFTFTVTVLLLGISFAIVFGLTKAQQSANDNRYLSIAISVTIALVNIILGLIIRFLTYYEKDYTLTNREASLAVKSILAQMINSIIIPVITAYEIKNDVYSTSGLVDNVFLLGITTAIVPPILVFIDPYNLFMKIMRCFKSAPSRKLYQNQKEHNLLHQGIQFQLGYHYIYIANVFLFTCFFVSLQPIVTLFALIGYFLMYWVQKYCVFNRYRRPVPSTNFVNAAVHKIIMLGPLAYSLGSLTWSNLTPGGIPEQALLPNLIAVGISALMLLIPLDTIILGSCFSQDYQKVKKYDDERLLFPSEYDRLNPSTQEEGIVEYKKYMDRKMDELKNCSKEKQIEIASLINRNAQRGQQINQRNTNSQMGGALQNLLGIQRQPMMGYGMGQPQLPMMGGLSGLMGFQPQQAQQPFFPFMAPQQQRQPVHQQPYQPRPPIHHAQPPLGMFMPPQQRQGPSQMGAMMMPPSPPPPAFHPNQNPMAMFNIPPNSNLQNRGNPHSMQAMIPRTNSSQNQRGNNQHPKKH